MLLVTTTTSICWAHPLTNSYSVRAGWLLYDIVNFRPTREPTWLASNSWSWVRHKKSSLGRSCRAFCFKSSTVMWVTRPFAFGINIASGKLVIPSLAKQNLAAAALRLFAISISCTATCNTVKQVQVFLRQYRYPARNSAEQRYTHTCFASEERFPSTL